MLTGINEFPSQLPFVNFTGPVIDSGLSLLRHDTTTELGHNLRKCCGFVQLSSYISPGKPDESPYKGYHPFQVFIIFPTEALPWKVLCEKMVASPQSRFQPGTFLSCSGYVAGFLDHDLMVHPPPQPQDYVFIITPETWTFHSNLKPVPRSKPYPPETPTKRSSPGGSMPSLMMFSTPSRTSTGQDPSPQSQSLSSKNPSSPSQDSTTSGH